MDIYMEMSTKLRHNKIACGFTVRAFPIVEQGASSMQEECSLVYWGKKGEPDFLKLVDLSEIKDMKKFKKTTMNALHCVQPDFVLFHKNKFTENAESTRVAGLPDLIVEIWSDGNSAEEKLFKHNLYSTSNCTEHWYIEQDSNEVACYFGHGKIENQSLLNILETRGGLKFDLRYLAI